MNKKHPSAWDPAIMLLNILVSVIGSIIGLELIARLGISTNTFIIVTAKISNCFLSAFWTLHSMFSFLQTILSIHFRTHFWHLKHI